MTEHLTRVPEAFKSYPQFIRVKNKIPINASGIAINPHEPGNWLSYEEILKTSGCWGFVFTDNDPFWFLDIDHCIDSTGVFSEFAMECLETFRGAYQEISSSGTGLHFFGTGNVPEHKCRYAGEEGNLELYHAKRFVLLSRGEGDASKDCTPEISGIVNRFLKKEDDLQQHPACTGVHLEDDLLIKKALSSFSPAAVFGSKCSFKALFERNIEELSQFFPSNSENKEFDYSNADAALARHLVFWTNKNEEQIKRIMWRSALSRDKWEREDYLARTISFVMSGMTKTYSAEAPKTSIKKKLDKGLLTLEEQLELFEGYTYVEENEQILSPQGIMLTEKQFKIRFGGYSFILSSTFGKPTRNAWTAFTETELYDFPRADSLCFKPTRAGGEIFRHHGRCVVNSYYPLPMPRKSGPAPLFEFLMSRLFPDPNDREIILCYLAALVQYPGVKFKWCIFIQGVPGNGKSLLIVLMIHIIGQVYCHVARNKDIENKFNGWLYRKIFVGIEDVKMTEDILEILKPLITGAWQTVEKKRIDSEMRDVCANFILNSNHKDGLLKSLDDRRIAPFFTPQQKSADLKRDGLTEEFFIKFAGWLETDGFEILTEYFHTYTISEKYNPATTCVRAPWTSSTSESIQEGHGVISQEILEAIEQGLPGFRGGWVSSVMLDRLLDTNKIKWVPRKRRAKLLEDLGYVRHPGLIDGRCNNSVLPDGSKARLFIREGHACVGLDKVALIERAYEEAQTQSVSHLTRVK